MPGGRDGRRTKGGGGERPATGPPNAARRLAVRTLALRPMMAVAVAAVVAMPATGWGQSLGRLRVGGSLPADCTLRILDSAQSLDLSGGVRDFPLARIGERCNSDTGYRIVLLSKNGGQLVGEGLALPYTVSFGPLRETTLAQPRALTVPEARTEQTTRTLSVSVPPPGPEAALSLLTDFVILSVQAP